MGDGGSTLKASLGGRGYLANTALNSSIITGSPCELGIC